MEVWNAHYGYSYELGEAMNSEGKIVSIPAGAPVPEGHILLNRTMRRAMRVFRREPLVVETGVRDKKGAAKRTRKLIDKAMKRRLDG